MVSVDDGIEYQGRRTFMTDTGWVVPSIEGDRTSRPWVEFWGDGLYGIDVPQCALAFPLGDMRHIDHVHYFHLGGEFLLSPSVQRARFIIILAWRSLPLMFGI